MESVIPRQTLLQESRLLKSYNIQHGDDKYINLLYLMINKG